MLFAFHICVAPFGDHVICVVLMSAEKQVTGADTRRIVAVVEHIHATRDRTVR